MAKVKCSKCGEEINLVSQDGYIINNAPNCEKCKIKLDRIDSKNE